jgi:hypothetical protein
MQTASSFLILLSPITMMTKVPTTVKIIVSVMVVTALVAASWESLQQQPKSKRSLRIGKERKLQTPPVFPDFSATSSFGVFTLPSFTSFNPGIMSLPTGGNAGGAIGAGFGDNTFFGAAGGSGGGMASSSGGGSISPVAGNATPFQITTFGSNSGNTAGGFGGGVVGEGASEDFFSNFPGFTTFSPTPP